MKAETLKDMPKYIKKDARLPILLNRSHAQHVLDRLVFTLFNQSE